MNGMMPERDRPATEAQGLQDSFRAFTQVTRNLEQAYRRLESRTTGVDPRLREANRRLMERVSELERAGDESGGIVDAIPCGVITCGEDRTLRRLNPAAERILGRAARELSGRDARTLRDFRGQPILLLGRDEVRTGETVGRLVGCLDGASRFLSGSVADLVGGGRLEVVSDQTEVAHLRSQVNRLDTLAALGEMAAGVAHGIRNPMSAVEGFAGLLEKALAAGVAAPNDALFRYADRIRRGVAEVNLIINDLLLWARPERVLLQEFRAADILDEIRGDAGAGRGEAGPAISVGVEPAGLRLRADRLKLKLALANLVRNAVEAASPRGRVEIAACPGATGAVLTVDDDGPGIPPEARLGLFRPFSTTKPGGTGLGLALARKFVELHDGEILVDAGPLGGARFTVILPQPREAAAG